jgi:hypothetical protein
MTCGVVQEDFRCSGPVASTASQLLFVSDLVLQYHSRFDPEARLLRYLWANDRFLGVQDQ